MGLAEEETKALSEKVLTAISLGSSVLLADLGYNVGLYDALADGTDPQTAGELATRTGLVERYVADWLANQAAAGFVSLVRPLEEPPRFFLNDAQKRVFVKLESPACQMAYTTMFTGLATNIVNRLPQDFKEGKGIAYGENNPSIYKVKELLLRKMPIDRFIDPVVNALPKGFKERLDSTGNPLVVVDVACGKGYISFI